MRETELVPVRVGDFVGRTMDQAHRMVLLHEQDGHRELAVMMTPDEGDAVEGALAETPPQPPVHALVLRVLQALQGRIDRIAIDRLDEDSSYAKVQLTGLGDSQTVDARASDGIVLALLTGARVYVARSAFEREAIDPLDMTQRRKMAAAARAALQKRLADRGPLSELVPPGPHRSLDPAARSQAEDSLGRLVAELGARSAFLIEQGGTVLASHGPGAPGIAARYAAARALGDTDLTELSMLDLFPEEEVDCILHATSDDGQLRLEAALPIGFGGQTAEEAHARGERLKTTVDELAVLLPSQRRWRSGRRSGTRSAACRFRDPRSRIFHPASPGPSDRMHAPNRGFGLGLAIVKAVAEAHHGRVAAESLEAGGLVSVAIAPVRSSSAAVGALMLPLKMIGTHRQAPRRHPCSTRYRDTRIRVPLRADRGRLRSVAGIQDNGRVAVK